MSYGPDFADLHRRNSRIVDKILKGTKPANIPVEEPAKFLLSVNMKTAKAIGMVIPHGMLVRAQEVIE
jgi:putative ABC transport system substrate-binding protein